VIPWLAPHCQLSFKPRNTKLYISDQSPPSPTSTTSSLLSFSCFDFLNLVSFRQAKMAALYTVQGAQVLVCMSGLPARGKTYIAQKSTFLPFLLLFSMHVTLTLTIVTRYLTWLSIPTKSFNVGEYRRQGGNEHPPASFFDPNNAEGARQRELAAQEAFNDLTQWFTVDKGVVGILDATNSTRKRREWIVAKCKDLGIRLMFVESVCTNEDLIMNNILDVKISSPDYIGQDPEKVLCPLLPLLVLVVKHILVDVFVS
jgi:6-phosphofructo-2-kinase